MIGQLPWLFNFTAGLDEGLLITVGVWAGALFGLGYDLGQSKAGEGFVGRMIVIGAILGMLAGLLASLIAEAV